jgi:SAM-dependent methyltransferase
MTDLGATFRHAGVADAYRHRPPYQPEVFDLLDSLITGEPRHVLDLGAGEGSLARPLAERVDRVDAIEISAAMVEVGRDLPGGTRDNLVWYVEPAEAMTVSGPYALATAGASLHWMDHEITLGRLAGLLAPDAVLAVVDQSYHRLGWQPELLEVIVAHTRNPDYDPGFSLPDDLQRRGLFEIRGRHQTTPTPFRQSVADYVESFHSRATLGRELMPAEEAELFDEKIRAVVRDHQDDQGMLTMQLTASLVWGRPV